MKDETPQSDGSNDVVFVQFRGRIGSDFTIGAELSGMTLLMSNESLSSNGAMLGGRGFLVPPESAMKVPSRILRPILNGEDLLGTSRKMRVIDFFGFSADEARTAAPAAYEQLLQLVKPERDSNRRASRRQRWWLFSEVMPQMRGMIEGLKHYIVTAETSKHRLFSLVDGRTLPEHRLVAIGSSDAFHLGVLTSRIHVVFSLAAGGTLEDRPVYNKSRCFDPFPFPDCTEKQKEKIRALAEELDAHRKRAQAQHGIGLTDLYNVLEKIRAASATNVGASLAGARVDPLRPLAGRASSSDAPTLTEKEKLLHDQALVATLRQLHDDLDAAVAAAYGWPWPLSDAEILERVVALNAARAAEEAKGIVRWLRPSYQKPLFAGESQSALALPDSLKLKAVSLKPEARRKAAWPKTLAARVRAVELALAAEEKPATATDLAKRFFRAKAPDILEILQTLVTLGRARPGDAQGTFVR